MVIDGTKLEIAMAKARKTGKDIMNETGISPVTVSRARNGKNISPIIAGIIADALKIDLEDIVKEV